MIMISICVIAIILCVLSLYVHIFNLNIKREDYGKLTLIIILSICIGINIMSIWINIK